MTTLPTTAQAPTGSPGMPQANGGYAAPGVGPADVLAALRRRSVLIVFLFVLFSAIAVGGFVTWWVKFPGFRGECLIECISNIPDAELSVEQQRLRQEEHERFVRSQAVLLMSPSILGEALKVTAVRETDWYKSVPGTDHLLELSEQLSALPVRGTNFLRVAIECRKRQDPATIVNTVVGQWYESVKRRSAEQFASKSLEAALGEKSELDRQIGETRAELRRIAARLPAGARHNPAGNATAQQVGQYGGQVAMLTLELSQLEQYRNIYNDPEGVAVTAEDRAIVELDPQVAELSRTLSLLEQRRAADAKVFGPRHRELKQSDAQIEAVKEQLTGRRQEKLRERRDDIREATNTAYLNTQHALFLGQENLARAEAALEDQDRLLFNYLNLEQEIGQETEFRIELNNYIKNLTRVVRQQTAVNINIAQPAIKPLEQSSPNVLMVPLGVFLALALSVGIALAIEFLDKSVRTSQDVVRYVDVPLLGAVPDTDDEEIDIERVETAVRDTPRSMVAEAFRNIRTSLQFSGPEEGQRSILVTSAQPEDGKTTVACNLALATAQSGRRVLLVDANFRRPSLHNIFEKAAGPGLSNILVGDSSLDDCLARTEINSLDVVGAGRIPPNPSELLGGEAFRTLLDELKSRYDQVIIDAAPVLLASDSLVLASAVDGVILVVRAKSNSRGEARRARGLLADVDARVFGAVLNAARVARGGYFREQLRTYYDYQAGTDAATPT